MEKRNIRFRTAFILWALFSFYLAGPVQGSQDRLRAGDQYQ